MIRCKKIWYGIWFFLIFFLDRFTKSMALAMTKPHTVNQFLEFRLAFNRGISWSMFHSENNDAFALLTCFIIGIILVLMFYTFKRAKTGKAIYAELLVLAGALSNVVDRFLYHGVIDFIHLHAGNWSWPIFNIADTVILLGVFWMIKEHLEEQ